MASTRIRPLVRRPGGKTRLLKELLPLPAHSCYVEAFAGGLAVLLAKARSEAEIVNDFDGDLVNLYRCVQFHPEALIAELQWTLSSRRNFLDCLAQRGLTDLQRSARWLLRNKTGFGGNMKTFGVSRTTGMASRENIQDAIRALSGRLDRVSVENLSYERMLTLYDSERTLFFLDPPYLNSDPVAYEGWNAEQMTEFARRVEALTGNWIVTVDDSSLNRELFRRWHITPVSTVNGGLNQKHARGKVTFGELVIRKHPPERVSVSLAVALMP